MVSQPVLQQYTEMQTSEQMHMIYVEEYLWKKFLWVDHGWALTAHQAPLSLPSSAGQGRVHMIHGSLVEIRAESDLSPVTVMGKTDLTWENQFNLLSKIAE